MLRNSPQKKPVNKEDISISNLQLKSQPQKKQETGHISSIRTLRFSKEAIKKELEIFCWRYKTYLPIIKPQQYNLNQNTKAKIACNFPMPKGSQYDKMGYSSKPNFQAFANRQSISNLQENSICELQVIIEPMKCKLLEIGVLPFSQILYLLKQMMVGYDALIDIFGTFDPSEQMIGVNTSKQWKIWINKNFFKNSKEESSSQLGHRQFIYRLLVMSEKHCQATSLSKIFFSEMKQYTYSNECGFIQMLQKIKDFMKTNLIFQVNKVTLPGERVQKSMLFDSFNHKSVTNLNSTQNFGKTKPEHKLKIQKKISVPCQDIYEDQSSSLSQLNKTNTLIPPQRFNFNKPQLQHTCSQKVINSSMFYYPQSGLGSCQTPKKFSDFSETWNNNAFLKPQPSQKKHVTSSYLPKSPQVIHSPKKQTQLDKPSTNLVNLSRSRHELKLIVNDKNKQSQPQPQTTSKNFLEVPQEGRGRKNINKRKYSEQLFKGKSVEALTAGINKVRGSQFYVQDPETRHQEVNVIKKRPILQDPISPTTPKHLMKGNPLSSNKTTVKDPGSSTPNHSSNSTNQMKNSQSNRNKSTNYQLLKMNDLNAGKGRNNQSSYYGMGDYPVDNRKDKNMTISYEFKNRNEVNSRSSGSNNKQQSSGNNWNKKLSGLFSDDNSIKHLKQSVKFKTAQQKLFQKEYLKDVKLQMLDKLGKQVRYSIADEDDDFCQKNPYKSMQLIQQVADEGKSYIEKEEEKIEEQQPVVMRGRHKTVQIMKDISEHKVIKIQQRQCVSVQCSQNDSSSEDCFNFESEGYNLTKI